MYLPEEEEQFQTRMKATAKSGNRGTRAYYKDSTWSVSCENREKSCGIHTCKNTHNIKMNMVFTDHGGFNTEVGKMA